LKWTNQLKIAIIENNELKIEELLTELPQFDSLEQMKEAAYMMQEAHTLLNKEKNILTSKLLKIKKQKEFLNSSIRHQSSFDQSH